MSESENNDAGDQESKHEHNPKKRIRHRKKQVYDNILKQMEFYFSDANLSKDRYLGDLVASDPYVPLSVFLKFNKIRTMTQDVTDIVKAMKYSTFLELSEDKLKVKRKTPVVPYDADLRTVYVESIPVTASRDWLERVFSDYGKVAYISLPKFKNSNKIKGFGFIEFARPQDAQKCINSFTEMGCKLPTCMPPEELSSIKMFSVEEPEEKQVEEKEYEPPKKKSKKAKDKKSNKSLELKLGSESDGERRVDTPTEDRSISMQDTSNVTTPDVETPTEENKTIDKESKDELTSHDESKNTEETSKRKKAKKRSKEKSKSKNLNLDKGEAPKGALWGLQVLAKNEWKVLRNKYLNLQRKYMKELKHSLQEKRRYKGIPAPAAASVEAENVPGGQEMGRAKPLLERIPGVFVKESLTEPCLDVKLTKRTIRSNIHALHVEVKEGQTEAIIRFDTAKAASDYCEHSANRARVLAGSEEEEQWTRADNALSAKRSRGRAKLLARTHKLADAPALAPASPQPTHTHIRFDE